ncbi:unnamed protein product [Arctogadus glacialis]
MCHNSSSSFPSCCSAAAAGDSPVPGHAQPGRPLSVRFWGQWVPPLPSAVVLLIFSERNLEVKCLVALGFD